MGTARTYDNLSAEELDAAGKNLDSFTTIGGKESKGTLVENTNLGKKILAEQKNNYNSTVRQRVTDRTNELYGTKGARPVTPQATTSAPESTDAKEVDREADVELGAGSASTPAARRRGRFRGGAGSISI